MMKRMRVTRVINKQPVINKHISKARRKRELGKGKPLITKDTLPTYTAEEKRPKIALIQTGCWGDNINSTLMFKPISDHFGDCLIDVYTSTNYGSAFLNNPYINKLIEYSSGSQHGIDKQAAVHLTLLIPDVIKDFGYDHIFAPHPMYNTGNWNSSKHPGLGENLIYAWVHALEKANIECPMPPQTILKLTEEEVAKVTAFREKIPEMGSRRTNIMEVHGESGQTFWNDTWTKRVVSHLCSKGEIVFISHRNAHAQLEAEFRGLCYSVNGLSIRECAELYNHCDKFFSISSGLSNACNTDWCRNDVEWIEVINSMVVSSAPIRSKNKTFWHENDLDKFLSTM